MDDLNRLVTFAQVVADHSFTQAARSLGMTPSGVSRAISRLEQELGVQLLTRTTRRLSLTHEGEVFYRRCFQILRDLEEAERLVTQSQTIPQGHLSVSMPLAFGRTVLSPAIVAFNQQCPLVSASITFSDRRVDLIEEGYDVVVRIGELEDSRLIVRPIATTELITCASQRYLEAHGMPKQVLDLQHHNCLGYINQKTGKVMDWYFAESNQTAMIHPTGSLNSTDGLALVNYAISHVGIVQLHNYLLEKALAQSNLVELFPDLRLSSHPISILYPRRRYESSAVKAFVNFLLEWLGQNP